MGAILGHVLSSPLQGDDARGAERDVVALTCPEIEGRACAGQDRAADDVRPRRRPEPPALVRVLLRAITIHLLGRVERDRQRGERLRRQLGRERRRRRRERDGLGRGAATRAGLPVTRMRLARREAVSCASCASTRIVSAAPEATTSAGTRKRTLVVAFADDAQCLPELASLASIPIFAVIGDVLAVDRRVDLQVLAGIDLRRGLHREADRADLGLVLARERGDGDSAAPPLRRHGELPVDERGLPERRAREPPFRPRRRAPCRGARRRRACPSARGRRDRAPLLYAISAVSISPCPTRRAPQRAGRSGAASTEAKAGRSTVARRASARSRSRRRPRTAPHVGCARSTRVAKSSHVTVLRLSAGQSGRKVPRL